MTNKTGIKNVLSPDQRRGLAERAAFLVEQNEGAYLLLAEEAGVSLDTVYKLRRKALSVDAEAVAIAEAAVAEARREHEWRRRVFEMKEG